MKLSVSLSEEDVAFLDQITRESGWPSRSAAIQAAVRSLRKARLSDAYAAAWDEWTSSGEEEVWSQAVRDGLVE